MSNAIQFLEHLGHSAAWGVHSEETYEHAIDTLQIDENQKRVLLERDHHALNRLLGGRMMMAMHVATPDNDESPEEAPSRRDDDEQAPEDFPGPAD